MTKNKTAIMIMTIILSSSLIYANQTWGARFPAPSPDGKRLAFSYYGDIWLVDAAGGKAERLTSSEGYESRSAWSPDGKWLAFMTDRWGNDDIGIMPVDGSAPPTRLTYYSMQDILFGWTPDSRYVLFGSYREDLTRVLYRLSVKGGMPEKITSFAASEVCFVPDGSKFYYSRRGAEWWRRKYQNGCDQDIWVKYWPDGKSEKVMAVPSEDGYPMFSPKTNKLYFSSNRDAGQVKNLWRCNPDGSAPEPVTFETEDIHFPEISVDGGLIAYECFGALNTFDVASGKTTRPAIRVNEDHQENPYYFKAFSGDATEFALSPDEKEIAFVVHGDIFVMELEEENEAGKVVRITNTQFIEKHVSWHPKKELLIYSAMADGDMDLYKVEPRTEKTFGADLLFDVSKLFDTGETEAKAKYSPDGQLVAYFKNGHELYVADRFGKNRKRLCPESDVLWIDWSPDSKWITFSRTVLGWREDIFVVPADGSTLPVNISNHPNDDYKPMWSSNGRRIAFGSRDAIGNLWMKYVFLRREDEERDDEYWEKDKDEDEGEDSTKSLVVRIDFDDIEERTHTVCRVEGFYNQVAQSRDGKQFAIHSSNEDSDDIWTVDWRGKELKRVTSGNVDPKMFFVSKDRKRIFYLSGPGRLASTGVEGGSPAALGFSVELGIDRGQERAEAFNEAWWALQDGFYDSDFHGTDWPALRTKYRELAVHTRARRDFQSVIGMMVGELNASHLGIWGGGDDGEETGCLGISYDSDYRGDGVKVKSVIPESPAGDEKVGIKPGDIITHIDGNFIKAGDNYFAYLANKVDKEIMITVSSTGQSRSVKVKPVGVWRIGELVDKSWVKANRAVVNEASHDKLGYVYIASMGESNLKTFEKDLYKELGKKGLIIDIRYNGGGSIHDELLNILQRTAYAYSVERDGQKEYSALFRWEKPIVVLINEYCYSDAEIFPAGFKQLKLGKVVGVPTFGAVIGTNNIRLLDGSTFRVPGTGWFRLNGVNLENVPVEPDIYVENQPEEDGTSSDRQLTKAIEVLMGEVGK